MKTLENTEKSIEWLSHSLFVKMSLCRPTEALAPMAGKKHKISRVKCFLTVKQKLSELSALRGLNSGNRSNLFSALDMGTDVGLQPALESEN